MRLDEVLALPVPVYDAWIRHLGRWPLGDSITHRLLAQLLAMTANAHFKLKKPAVPGDYLPSLRVKPNLESNRQARLQEQRLMALEYAERQNATT